MLAAELMSRIDNPSIARFPDPLVSLRRRRGAPSWCQNFLGMRRADGGARVFLECARWWCQSLLGMRRAVRGGGARVFLECGEGVLGIPCFRADGPPSWRSGGRIVVKLAAVGLARGKIRSLERQT
jgi:hypothetical protein